MGDKYRIDMATQHLAVQHACVKFHFLSCCTYDPQNYASLSVWTIIYYHVKKDGTMASLFECSANGLVISDWQHNWQYRSYFESRKLVNNNDCHQYRYSRKIVLIFSGSRDGWTNRSYKVGGWR